MDFKSLFFKLLNAQDEQEVNSMIATDKNLSNNSLWYPYGGRDINDRSNFGTFENQQSNPVPALIEKITNSIDSLLLKRCRIQQIDPTSKNAPDSMEKAVAFFYGIKNGDFSEISHFDRRNIAEDIQVIAEGDKQCPNILIYDNGEGQHPDDFSQSFLSLSRCNKTNIPFVQGKYNMGSTGAVIFCGEFRYQLIGSRLHEKLNRDKSNDFGFTLVRKHPLNDDEDLCLKSSWYEYFFPNNMIPRFSADILDLGLYGRKFEHGSIIKLYSYSLPRGSRSAITFDLWRDLNQYLYHPALPFIVYEKRYHVDKTKNPTKQVLGNKIRLILDERDKKEKTITISISDSFFGEVPIEVHIFKSDVDQKEFINNKAVVFTVNGQVHGFLQRSFISQELGFSMLKDSLLIQVDCSNTKTSFRQDLFKGSRDRLNEGPKTEYLIDKIIAVLKSNDELKQFNKVRKNKILRESTEDKNLLENVLSSLPIDKEILKLLKNNTDFNFFKKQGIFHKKIDDDRFDKDIKKYKHISKRFPSIFRIELPEDKSGKLIKSIPLYGKGIIRFETDVEDEYLFRPKDKGELQIVVLGFKNNISSGGRDLIPSKVEDWFDVTKTGPVDNAIRVTFEPKRKLDIDDEIQLNAKLTSPAGNLESIFWIKIINPQKENNKIQSEKPADAISPPLPIRVYEKAEKEGDKTWRDYDWNGTDIIKIITDSDPKGNFTIEAIAVNMDCYVFKKFLSRKKIKTEEEIKYYKNHYFLAIYLHGLFLYSILDSMNKSIDNDDYSKIDIDDIIPTLFKPYSDFLLSSIVIEK